MATSDALEADAARLAELLLARGWMMATAESCTGGWIAQTATAIAGSSAWFDRGFVTYSNAAKQEMLGVAAGTLAEHGAVSGETAAQMVAGAIDASAADIAVAVTGVAGPGGGTAAKPVGTVWFGWQLKGSAPLTLRRCFAGDRRAIREQTVAEALAGLIELARR